MTENSPNGFGKLGIAGAFIPVLDKLHLTSPTPIQEKAIPVAIAGNDIIGIAQTGTGKTFAFGIPMIQRLSKMKGQKGLIILPTRELALQVNDALLKIGGGFGLKTAVLIGGASMGLQLRDLRNDPHIVIGTPGRINDHLEQRTMHLHQVGVLVLDEADHMFDMGFAPQIKRIISQAPIERQTMLFSATMPPEILKLAVQYMKSPVSVEVATQGTVAKNVDHSLYFVKKEDRIRLLDKLLTDHQGSVLVFLRTKHNAKKVCQQMNAMGFKTAEIHSNRSLGQRKEALDGFKSGKYRVLVATDIAARGIDVKGIELVINYDLPENPPDYVHRIGRTARAGAKGKAISFVMPDQKSIVREIERLIKTPIDAMPEVQLPAARGPVFTKTPFVDRNRQNNHFQRGNKGPYRPYSGRPR
jgi:ATP-dependent RNA helicase RhlE